MTCYKYWGKILEIADTIKKYNGNVPKDVRFSILKSLEKIAHDNTISFDEAQHIFKNKFMSKALNVIYNFYNKMSVQMEIEHAEKVINSDDPWKTLKSFYFYDRYVKLVQNEAMLAKYNSDDRIVFIGGGPLPLTLILTNKLFSMKGVSIEIVPKLAEKSKKVLEKLGLSNEIKVVCGDETALKNLNFDIVIIAALAEPKKRVFKNVKKYVSPKTRIIYRTYTGMRAILYSPVKEEYTKGFVKKGLILPSGKVNNTSVLIQLK